MKALSIRQPWAWAILHAGKPVENRTWKTALRGPLLIHASARMTSDDAIAFQDSIRQLEEDLCAPPDPAALQFGGIIGIVDVVDCVSEHPSPWLFGPYGFVFANPRPVEFILWQGKLGFFEVPDDLVRVA